MLLTRAKVCALILFILYLITCSCYILVDFAPYLYLFPLPRNGICIQFDKWIKQLNYFTLASVFSAETLPSLSNSQWTTVMLSKARSSKSIACVSGWETTKQNSVLLTADVAGFSVTSVNSRPQHTGKVLWCLHYLFWRK